VFWLVSGAYPPPSMLLMWYSVATTDSDEPRIGSKLGRMVVVRIERA